MVVAEQGAQQVDGDAAVGDERDWWFAGSAVLDTWLLGAVCQFFEQGAEAGTGGPGGIAGWRHVVAVGGRTGPVGEELCQRLPDGTGAPVYTLAQPRVGFHSRRIEAQHLGRDAGGLVQQLIDLLAAATA